MDYTGLAPEESHGWGWQVAFHPEDLPPLMEKWRELLISGEPGEIEARLRRSDGVYRWFSISVEPFHDEAGRTSSGGTARALISRIASKLKSGFAKKMLL